MASAIDRSAFKYAGILKDRLAKRQAREVTKLYGAWADEIQDLADYYGRKGTYSAPFESLYYQQLKRQVTEQSKIVANEVYNKTTKAMNIVSDAVIGDNATWLKSMGFTSDAVDTAFSGMKQGIVNSIVTGQVYGKSGSWSLSKAIWSDNDDTLKKIYQIVAQGYVMQMPTGEIAKKLEQFVNPAKQFKWNSPKGYPPIYGKKVDYSAQRLARTLIQHTYQKSFIAVAKANPLVEKVRWVSNGSRVCPLCMSRDGKVYAILKVPLEHPNGMCVLEPVIDWDKLDELADWVNSPDSTNTWWDNKMKAFGYEKGRTSKRLIVNSAKKAAKVADKVLAGSKRAEMEDSIEVSTRKFRDAMKAVRRDRRCGLTDEVIDELAATLRQSGNKGIADAYYKLVKDTKGLRFTWDDGNSYYSHTRRSLFKKIAVDVKEYEKVASAYKVADKSKHFTIFHEMGHAIDDSLSSFFKSKGTFKDSGRITRSKRFRDALKKDLKRVSSMKLSTVLKSRSPNGISQYDFRVKEAYRVQGASDFLSGVHALRNILPELDKRIADLPRYGSYINFAHSEEYYTGWKDDDMYFSLCSELFANCCSAIATNDAVAIKALKLVVPNFFAEVIALFG